MKKNSCLVFTLLSFVIIFSSCSQKIYKEYNLFQKGLDSLQNFEYKPLVVQNNDVLNIQIFSATLSQDQAAIFNLGSGSGSAASMGGGSAAAAGGGSSSDGAASKGGGVDYEVNLSGKIIMPVIGTVDATGLTTEQIRKLIADKLDPIIKDPIVNVRFSGIKVNVLGEVKFPGIKVFNKSTPTFLDAIGQAGDFTDRALRNKVYLIRDINGKRTTFILNMNDASIFTSEDFKVMQNDLIYVPADDIKLKTLNVDPDLQKRLQITSMVVTVMSSLALILNTFYILKRL